jgi:hypothetical protein
MTLRRGCRLALTVCALALILGGSPQAGAQPTRPTLPESAFAVSHEPAVYKRQLQMAAQSGRRVLAGLQAASPDDATPIDERVQREARDTYGLLRSARAGMDRAKTAQKFPDPVLELTLKRVTQAWDLSRVPVDQLSWGNTRQEYLAKAIPALTESLRVLDQVLAMMP